MTTGFRILGINDNRIQDTRNHWHQDLGSQESMTQGFKTPGFNVTRTQAPRNQWHQYSRYQESMTSIFKIPGTNDISIEDPRNQWQLPRARYEWFIGSPQTFSQSQILLLYFLHSYTFIFLSCLALSICSIRIPTQVQQLVVSCG